MGRMERVNEQMRREIGLILQQEMSDSRFQFVTITKVDVTPDLRSARVYFTYLGNAEQTKQAKEFLTKASKLIRRYVGGRIQMRFTPELFFVIDKSLEMERMIEETIQERAEHDSENS